MLRFIYWKSKQTVVAAVGVTFGIAMFIALVSFMNGLKWVVGWPNAQQNATCPFV
jgi:uncharacterized membrane protein